MGKENVKLRFGKRVRELRIKHGWIQVELARQAGISRSYLQKIESQNPPDVTLDVIAKLARGFGLSCSKIVKYSPNK